MISGDAGVLLRRKKKTMKLKYTLAAGALALATATQAQSWTPDTISTGVGYIDDGFYNLSSGQVKQEAAGNWDIAFITGQAFSAAVMVNHYGGSTGASGTQRGNKLYDLNLDAATKWGTDLTADTAGKVTPALALENQPLSWEEGAFNQNVSGPMNFGWGDYDVSTHWTTGNKVYLLLNKNGAYQIWIEQYQASLTAANRLWKFHIAKLDGTESASYDFHPAAEGYTNKLFAYFDVATRQFVNREPDMDNWHLLATRYPDAYHDTSSTWMSTTGILTNINVKVAARANAIPDNATQGDALSATYSDYKNVIGGKYKVVNVNGTPPGWEVYDSLSYFVKIIDGTDSGDIWQVYFDYFPAGTSGDVKIGLQKRKIYDYTEPPVTAVNEVNTVWSNVLLAPNPAVGGTTNLLIDTKEDIKDAQIVITDLSGRALNKFTTHIKQGFVRIPLNTSQYPAGIYMVNLSGAGFSTTQKLVVK